MGRSRRSALSLDSRLANFDPCSGWFREDDAAAIPDVHRDWHGPFSFNLTVDRSAKIDVVVSHHKMRCRDERFDLGGGKINVAVVITELGGEALAIYTFDGLVGGLPQRLVACPNGCSATTLYRIEPASSSETLVRM